jgi:hypothetical protein
MIKQPLPNSCQYENDSSFTFCPGGCIELRDRSNGVEVYRGTHRDSVGSATVPSKRHHDLRTRAYRREETSWGSRQ